MSAPWVVLLFVGGSMVLLWLVSLLKRDASVVDVFWGPGFALAAWIYWMLGHAAGPRGLLVPVLVTLWALRLGGYILWRGWGEGEDYRYRQMREGWGAWFPWASLVTVFLLQAAILWAVSMPLWQVQRSPEPTRLTWLDWGGLSLFLIGFFFETVGDWQLARFKSDPRNRGRVLDRGLWRYTRHPNYFGDAVVWWGLFLFALATGSWWTLYSPLLMTLLLMKVSGVSLLEKNLEQTKPAYRDYVLRTSAFFPWLPKRSRNSA